MGNDAQPRRGSSSDVSLCGLEGRIASRYGILPYYGWSIVLARAVERACRRRGIETPELLRSSFHDEGLFRELAGALAPADTGLFRQPEHLALVVARVPRWLPEVRAGHPLRFWSIGCATGEEPFSLAMMLADKLPPELLAMVEIVGTDINLESIATAREGWVSAATLGAVPENLAKRFFETERDGRVRLTRAVRDRVSFEHLSAREALVKAAPDSLHAVLFCDVAAYLERDTVRMIHDGVVKALRSDGMLFLAPGDARPGHPRLVPVAGGPAGAYELDPPREDCEPERSQEFDEPDALRRVRELIERGDRMAARELVDRMIGQSPRDGRAWQLRGVLMLADSRVEEALEALRRASYLLGNDEINEYYVAVALERAGHRGEALRCALRLSERLVGRHDGALMGDRTLTAGALLRAAKILVERLL